MEYVVCFAFCAEFAVDSYAYSDSAGNSYIGWAMADNENFGTVAKMVEPLLECVSSVYTAVSFEFVPDMFCTEALNKVLCHFFDNPREVEEMTVNWNLVVYNHIYCLTLVALGIDSLISDELVLLNDYFADIVDMLVALHVTECIVVLRMCFALRHAAYLVAFVC